jgi:mono/diheme cytochrome c family protein
MKAVLKAAVLLFVLAGVVLAAAFIWIGSRGISARAEPGAVETAVARTMRRLAIPRAARDRQNPVAATPEVIAAGMAHYANHCASCHANDGSGDTEIGRGLYPKAPDMRLEATQSLSDGELFFIIENGVRLTGMPAWGTGSPDEAEQTWHLVHFIRHLVRITDAELEEMKSLNPISPEELRQQIEEEKFLSGETVTPPPTGPTQHGH